MVFSCGKKSSPCCTFLSVGTDNRAYAETSLHFGFPNCSPGGRNFLGCLKIPPLGSQLRISPMLKSIDEISDFQLFFQLSWTAINVIFKGIFALLFLNISFDLFLRNMNCTSTVITSCPEIIKTFAKVFISKIF